jgi:clan AA aspartic protease (TIGR02281 family)
MTLFADTIYFNNGNSREGVITSEGPGSVEMDIGSGTVAFARKDIRKIERSGEADKAALNEKWQEEREGIDKKRALYEADRKRRFSEYDQWTAEAVKESERRYNIKANEVPLTADVNSKGLVVEVLINGKVNTTLILDTGADIVLLSKEAGQKLGIDLTDTNQMVELHLPGDRRVKARMVVLESVKAGGVEEKNVRAGILLTENTGLMLRDGLFGMTFLSRYNFKIDRKRMVLILEKI